MQSLPIVVRNRMGVARWGFRPSWAKEDDKAMAAKMINCRSETAAEKPAFRDAWARGRRCLVPADGFYEWHTGEDGVKQPYYIHRADGNLLCFAGLWSKFDTPDGAQVSFTVLTKPADGEIEGLHHRMPVVLGAEQAGDWFSASADEAHGMIDAVSGQDLAFHAVAQDVGKVANDSSQLIEKIAV